MTVKDSLMTIEDFRIDRCKKRKLVDILMIVFFGLLCGYKSIEEIDFYAELSIDVLKKYLELANGIPSSDTILQVLARLETKELENDLLNMQNKLSETNLKNAWKKLLIIYNAKALILEKESESNPEGASGEERYSKDITIDKDELEQEIEFNFDIQRLRDENELELEVIPRIVVSGTLINNHGNILLVGIGGQNE